MLLFNGNLLIFPQISRLLFFSIKCLIVDNMSQYIIPNNGILQLNSSVLPLREGYILKKTRGEFTY